MKNHFFKIALETFLGHLDGVGWSPGCEKHVFQVVTRCFDRISSRFPRASVLRFPLCRRVHTNTQLLSMKMFTCGTKIHDIVSNWHVRFVAKISGVGRAGMQNGILVDLRAPLPDIRDNVILPDNVITPSVVG